MFMFDVCSVNEAQEMGEDLREKEKELGHSKTTQQRLEDVCTADVHFHGITKFTLTLLLLGDVTGIAKEARRT